MCINYMREVLSAIPKAIYESCPNQMMHIKIHHTISFLHISTKFQLLLLALAIEFCKVCKICMLAGGQPTSLDSIKFAFPLLPIFCPYISIPRIFVSRIL